MRPPYGVSARLALCPAGVLAAIAPPITCERRRIESTRATAARPSTPRFSPRKNISLKKRPSPFRAAVALINALMGKELPDVTYFESVCADQCSGRQLRRQHHTTPQPRRRQLHGVEFSSQACTRLCAFRVAGKSRIPLSASSTAPVARSTVAEAKFTGGESSTRATRPNLTAQLRRSIASEVETTVGSLTLGGPPAHLSSD